MKQEYVDSSWKTITTKYIFCLPSFLPKELCLNIREQGPYGNSNERHDTEVGWSAKYYTTRLDMDHALNDELNQHLVTAWDQAIAYYGVDVDVYEPYEVKKYVAGDSISEHVDLFYQLKPKERKLTMIAQLSDTDEYEGGDVSIAPFQTGDRSIGSVIIIPSFHLHAVRKVVQGTRWSLNSWAWGPFWK